MPWSILWSTMLWMKNFWRPTIVCVFFHMITQSTLVNTKMMSLAEEVHLTYRYVNDYQPNFLFIAKCTTKKPIHKSLNSSELVKKRWLLLLSFNNSQLTKRPIEKMPVKVTLSSTLITLRTRGASFVLSKATKARVYKSHQTVSIDQVFFYSHFFFLCF